MVDLAKVIVTDKNGGTHEIDRYQIKSIVEAEGFTRLEVNQTHFIDGATRTLEVRETAEQVHSMTQGKTPESVIDEVRDRHHEDRKQELDRKHAEIPSFSMPDHSRLAEIDKSIGQATQARQAADAALSRHDLSAQSRTTLQRLRASVGSFIAHALDRQTKDEMRRSTLETEKTRAATEQKQLEREKAEEEKSIERQQGAYNDCQAQRREIEHQREPEQMARHVGMKLQQDVEAAVLVNERTPAPLFHEQEKGTVFVRDDQSMLKANELRQTYPVMTRALAIEHATQQRLEQERQERNQGYDMGMSM